MKLLDRTEFDDARCWVGGVPETRNWLRTLSPSSFTQYAIEALALCAAFSPVRYRHASPEAVKAFIATRPPSRRKYARRIVALTSEDLMRRGIRKKTHSALLNAAVQRRLDPAAFGTRPASKRNSGRPAIVRDVSAWNEVSPSLAEWLASLKGESRKRLVMTLDRMTAGTDPREFAALNPQAAEAAFIATGCPMTNYRGDADWRIIGVTRCLVADGIWTAEHGERLGTTARKRRLKRAAAKSPG